MQSQEIFNGIHLSSLVSHWPKVVLGAVLVWGFVPVVYSSWFAVSVLLVVLGFTMGEGSLSKLGWPCIEVSLSVSEQEQRGSSFLLACSNPRCLKIGPCTKKICSNFSLLTRAIARD